MHESHPYHSQGFSLVEVMMAVFVLSIGIIAIASMQSTSSNSATNARLMVCDSVAVGRYIEQMLSLSYDHNQLADTDRGYKPQHPDHGPYRLTDSRSTIEWEVTDDFPSVNAKRISVTVRRTGRGGQLHQVCYNYIKVKGDVP